MSAWQDILKGAARGVVRVTLSPGAEYKRPKRRPGRPRVSGLVPFAHYAGYNTTRGGRPRCEKRGCTTYLTRHQRVACSPEHRRDVVLRTQALLKKAGVV